MKNQFVPYELALKLKELGFNEECLGLWYWRDDLFRLGEEEFYLMKISYFEVPEHYTLAPLWQQAESFLRTKIPFHIIFREDGWYWEVLHEGHFSKNGNFKTYEEGRQACLEKLIEILNHERNKQI